MSEEFCPWPWLLSGCFASLAASTLMVAAGWKFLRRKISVSLIPLITYLAAFVLFWVVAPPFVLLYIQFFQVELFPGHPIVWLLAGPVGLLGLLVGSSIATRTFSSPGKSLALNGQQELAAWLPAGLISAAGFFIPADADGVGSFFIRCFKPLLIVGPVFSLHRAFSYEKTFPKIARFLGVGIFALLVSLDGGRLTGGLVLLLIPVVGLACGLPPKRMLWVSIVSGAAGFSLLALFGLIRVAVDDVDWRHQRQVRDLEVYRKALGKLDLRSPYGFFSIGTPQVHPLASIVSRLPQIESLWLMEATESTGYQHGWRGATDLPSAMVPKFFGGERQKLYDAPQRYALYGFRPRENLKSSALPLRTLADLYERFRWPGVFIFHALLGGWLILCGCLALRFLPSWWALGALAVWTPLVVGSLEMGFLDNLNRFTYGFLRDGLLVGATLGPGLFLAQKLRTRSRG